MIIAADSSYPLLNVLWDMLIFFSWILWIWLLVVVYMDIFRRDDIGGGAKTAWVVFCLIVPFIGVFTYLITQGRGMGERRESDLRRQQADLDQYIRSAAATGSANGADQLAKAKSLLDSGALTPAEYEQMKRKVLT